MKHTLNTSASSSSPQKSLLRTGKAALAAMLLLIGCDTKDTAAHTNNITKHSTESQGTHLETFKNITANVIGPAHVDGQTQKRYHDISIENNGNHELPTGTIMVFVSQELDPNTQYQGTLFRHKQTGDFSFTPTKKGNSIDAQVPSEGNGQQ